MQHKLDVAGCDTSDMRLIHRVFRVTFADGPALIDGVAAEDAEHRRAVVDHLEQLASALHNHHVTEDAQLWDRLEARAPGCAVHVGLMRKQHADMGRALDETKRAIAAWAASGSVTDAATARASLVRVNDLLDRHLGDEERDILPEASRVFTQREWNRLGDVARRETPARMIFPQLGFLLDAMTPDEGAAFMAQTMPPPLRLLWRVVGVGQYRRYRRRVYGAAA